jgi:membrane dipeptidase
LDQFIDHIGYNVQLTKRLLERGYKEEDVKKILGVNWTRVYREVWGG